MASFVVLCFTPAAIQVSRFERREARKFGVGADRAVNFVPWRALTPACGTNNGQNRSSADESARGTIEVEFGDSVLCDDLKHADIESRNDAVDVVGNNQLARSFNTSFDPLYCAIAGSNLAAVELLIELGVKPSWKSPTEPVPLADALRIGRRSLNAMDSDMRDSWDANVDAILQLLIEHGMDPCDVYTDGIYSGRTAFEVSVLKDENRELFERNNADCTSVDWIHPRPR